MMIAWAGQLMAGIITWNIDIFRLRSIDNAKALIISKERKSFDLLGMDFWMSCLMNWDPQILKQASPGARGNLQSAYINPSRILISL